MKKLKFIFLLLLFLVPVLFAQDVGQQEDFLNMTNQEIMQNLSQSIRQELQNWKQKTKDYEILLAEQETMYQTSLKMVQKDLQLSENDRLKSETLKNELNTCLQNMTKKYEESCQKINDYENLLIEEKTLNEIEKKKNQKLTKILISLILVFTFMILIKIVFGFLKAKYNITLPYYLNLLL